MHCPSLTSLPELLKSDFKKSIFILARVFFMKLKLCMSDYWELFVFRLLCNKLLTRHLVYTNFCPSTQILIHIKGGSSQIPTHNWKGLSDRHIKQSNTSEIRSNNPQSKAKYSRICCLLVTKQLLNIFQRFSASSLTNFGKSSNYFFLWSTWKHDFDFQNCLRLVNYI